MTDPPRRRGTDTLPAWLVPLILSLPHGVHAEGPWQPQSSGTEARLRGISVVSPEVAWASGSAGTCLRTIDGGKTWTPRTVPGSSGLDFRDVHAVGTDVAYLLSIGAEELSRIYKTTDGGASWAVQHGNADPRVFLDALAFWDPDHGIALGDPVEGRFTILTTDDGGRRWNRHPPAGMPPALPGEGAFAASGTCLVVQGAGHAWFCTGGAPAGRVFRSTDRGRSWTAHETPVRAGRASAGLFSLAFRDAEHGVAVGGDYKEPDARGRYVALTADGGRTWTPARGTPPGGYRSAVAYADGTTLLTVGPNGSDRSLDGGESWHSLGPAGFDAVSFAGRGAGWAVGEHGHVARFVGDPAGR